MKSLVIKSIFVIISWAILHSIQSNIVPMATADIAVQQLQDSDVSYATFKGWQGLMQWYFVLYLLPLVVFTKNIKNTFKNLKGE